MPNRIFSDRAWTSDKLAQVQPDEFRPEYAWIYSLALCDGTFECDPKRIWGTCYAVVRDTEGPNAWTPAKVAKMLDEFERVGLLIRKQDHSGKIWGFWVGCEELLPPRGHWFKYKRGKGFLFIEGVESLYADDSRTSSGQGVAKVGTTGVSQSRPVLGSGLGKVVVEVSVGDKSPSAIGQVFDEALAEQDSPADKTPGRASSQFSFVKGRYPGTDPKRIFAHISKAWVRVRGQAAVCRYPSKYPEQWERLCDSHSGDILVPAFELWATKHGYNTEWPITEFLKVAGEFMQYVLPLNEVKPKVTQEQVKASDEASLKAREALWTETTNTEPGPEQF